MRDGERKSLATQITRCYSDNKNSPFRAHLTLCSFGGKLRERFENVLVMRTDGKRELPDNDNLPRRVLELLDLDVTAYGIESEE